MTFREFYDRQFNENQDVLLREQAREPMLLADQVYSIYSENHTILETMYSALQVFGLCSGEHNTHCDIRDSVSFSSLRCVYLIWFCDFHKRLLSDIVPP